jgi:hypothetical protein
MKKTTHAVMISALFIFIFTGCIIHAQRAGNSQKTAQPSLKDTEKWIAQTFDDHIVHKGREHIDFDNAGNTQCSMYFYVTEQFDILNPQIDEKIRFMQLVDLSDIDPATIKASELIHDTDITTVKDTNQIDYSTHTAKDHPYVFVRIKTTNDKDSITSSMYMTYLNGEHHTMEREVGFDREGVAVEPEYAPRFIKALRHAVELCGGKPSAF